MFAEEPDAPASFLFLQAVHELLEEHGLQFPVTVQDAVCLNADLASLFEAEI